VTEFGVRDAVVRFGPHEALSQVSIDVPAGQVTAVGGGDGAGKTTLLRALVGRVAVDEGRVNAPPRENIGYLPASAGSWLDLSVQENIDFVGGAYGLTGEALRERSEPLLERADLTRVRERLSRRLSGGMRRKLGFCLAMLPNPKLLVLDEPSTGVDPVSRVDLWRLVSEAAAHGAAVIMSTTYLDEAERCATLLVLDKGRTLLKGPPRDVVASLSGTVVATTSPVRPEFGWRRGQQFLEWWPAGQLPTDGTAIEPDLEDVVIAASMEVRLTAGARR
jgi:ABC-2 type transport system ATP-binding protein